MAGHHLLLGCRGALCNTRGPPQGSLLLAILGLSAIVAVVTAPTPVTLRTRMPSVSCTALQGFWKGPTPDRALVNTRLRKLNTARRQHPTKTRATTYHITLRIATIRDIISTVLLPLIIPPLDDLSRQTAFPRSITAESSAAKQYSLPGYLTNTSPPWIPNARSP